MRRIICRIVGGLVFATIVTFGIIWLVSVSIVFNKFNDPKWINTMWTLSGAIIVFVISLVALGCGGIGLFVQAKGIARDIKLYKKDKVKFTEEFCMGELVKKLSNNIIAAALFFSFSLVLIVLMIFYIKSLSYGDTLFFSVTMNSIISIILSTILAMLSLIVAVFFMFKSIKKIKAAKKQ